MYVLHDNNIDIIKGLVSDLDSLLSGEAFKQYETVEAVSERTKELTSKIYDCIDSMQDAYNELEETLKTLE